MLNMGQACLHISPTELVLKFLLASLSHVEFAYSLLSSLLLVQSKLFHVSTILLHEVASFQACLHVSPVEFVVGFPSSLCGCFYYQVDLHF